MPARVVSCNIGLPREVEWQGERILTGIFKEPVAGKVKVGKLTIAGDTQADLKVHGGADKAVYGYPSEHYEHWRREFPRTPMTWGMFGENLTTSGLREDSLHLGDRFRVGSTTLMVTTPRLPCFKLGIKFGESSIIPRFLKSLRSGFYFAVVEEGEIEAGDLIEPLDSGNRQVSISQLVRLYTDAATDRSLVLRALESPALPDGWRRRLQARYNSTDA